MESYASSSIPTMLWIKLHILSTIIKVNTLLIEEFDISLEWFQKLLSIDPFRFENMDTYSNILYIKENQGELATLALKEFYNNKYNP